MTTFYCFEREGNNMFNILICDDDKEIVDAIAIYLETEGYKVLKAYNGVEALNGYNDA